jgi:preprotein translocase subunit SecY
MSSSQSLSADSSERNGLKRGYGNSVVLLLYVLVTMAMTYPAILYLRTKVIGGPGDQFHFLWELWYVARSLFDLNKSPFFDLFAKSISWCEPLYTLIYVTLIIFFAFFYVGIIFNPTELADNMRKYGGFIPGIRPGRNTSEHINRILSRLTLVGGVYLAIVCLLPEWMISGIHLQHLPVWLGGNWFDQHMWRFVLDGLGVQFYFGGTSLLIVVGVAMDTVQQLEAQLVMRNYEGFVRKGRVRSRRG